MPRIHEREALTNKALVELLEWLDQWAKRHQLTHLEKLIALRDTANHYVDTYFKHELRYERHGDTDTPAGWAKDGEPEGVNGCGQFLRTCKCGHPEHAHLMRPAPGYEMGCQVCDCKAFEPAGG